MRPIPGELLVAHTVIAYAAQEVQKGEIPDPDVISEAIHELVTYRRKAIEQSREADMEAQKNWETA
jgi:hypothetical protein